MATFFRRLLGSPEHKYVPLAGLADGGLSAGVGVARSDNIWTRKHIGLLIMLGALAAIAGVFTIGYLPPS